MLSPLASHHPCASTKGTCPGLAADRHSSVLLELVVANRCQSPAEGQPRDSRMYGKAPWSTTCTLLFSVWAAPPHHWPQELGVPWDELLEDIGTRGQPLPSTARCCSPNTQGLNPALLSHRKGQKAYRAPFPQLTPLPPSLDEAAEGNRWRESGWEEERHHCHKCD